MLGMAGGFLGGLAQGIGDRQQTDMENKRLQLQQQQMQNQQNQFDQTFNYKAGQDSIKNDLNQKMFNEQKANDTINNRLVQAQTQHYNAMVQAAALGNTKEKLQQQNAMAGAVTYLDDSDPKAFLDGYKYIYNTAKKNGIDISDFPSPDEVAKKPDLIPHVMNQAKAASILNGDALKVKMAHEKNIMDNLDPTAKVNISEQAGFMTPEQADARRNKLNETSFQTEMDKIDAATANAIPLFESTLGHMQAALAAQSATLRGPFAGKVGELSPGGEDITSVATDLALQYKNLMDLSGMRITGETADLLKQIQPGNRISDEAATKIVARLQGDVNLLKTKLLTKHPELADQFKAGEMSASKARITQKIINAATAQGKKISPEEASAAADKLLQGGQ
jgi:hypothetical protein